MKLSARIGQIRCARLLCSKITLLAVITVWRPLITRLSAQTGRIINARLLCSKITPPVFINVLRPLIMRLSAKLRPNVDITTIIIGGMITMDRIMMVAAEMVAIMRVAVMRVADMAVGMADIDNARRMPQGIGAHARRMK